MIIITGASDGLGLELAKICKENGKKVVNISRSKSDFADINISCDFTDSPQIDKAVNEVISLEEPIEWVVNCAGVMSLEPLNKITKDEFDRVMYTNLRSQILLISGLANKIIDEGADIINVASTVGTKGYVEQAIYGASKWGVRGFSVNLQEEFKKKPNRVVSFCVGGFNSEILKKVNGKDIADPENWMDPVDIAKFMYQIMLLPKNMEVSEIIIQRKAIN